MDTKTDIRSMTGEELKETMRAMGEPAFRANQIYSWLHQKLAFSADEMTNLPAALRNRLANECMLETPRPLQVLTSKIDGTQKYLFELEDGNVIESVLMRYHHGNSVCISSQAGCRMGCRFCASGIGGLKRSLTASEMLGQIYRISALSGERVDSVVVMGTGEPLDNYDNLLRFIHLLCSPDGLHLSQRAITVSTCGIVPNMERLAKERLQITLALSLHASTQEKREQLMPIARKYEIHDVLNACRNYFEKTGRRVTFEYSLVAGVNDTPEDVRELKMLLKGSGEDTAGRNTGRPHMNLIPVNPIRERSFRSPDRQAVEAFKNQLEKAGINVTIRREMGRDISGACGQLRRSYLESAQQ